LCIRRLVFRENKAVHVAPLWEPRPRGERCSSVQKSFGPGAGLPQEQSSARLSHCGNRHPAANGAARRKKSFPPGAGLPQKQSSARRPIVGAATPRRMAQLGAKKASPRGRASHKNKAVHVAPLWKPRPRGEWRSSVQKKASPRGRASHKNKAVHVAPLWEPRPRGEWRSSVLKKLRPGGGPPTTAIVGAATPRRTAQPGAEKASARGRASHKNKAVHVAPLWEPRPRGEWRSLVLKSFGLGAGLPRKQTRSYGKHQPADITCRSARPR